MSSNIPIPLFLQPGKAQELNNRLIKNNKSFSFLGEPAEFINKIPSTYAEAFDQYISALYVLYHDYGMFFLRSYTNQSIVIHNDFKYNSHICFVLNSRGAILHSDDYETRDSAYKTLKNYFFLDDITFTFSDWKEFWLNADNKQWKRLVDKLVNDSNKLYKDYVKKIAEHDPSLQSIYESISEIFRTGEYVDKNGYHVKMYIRSFDERLLRIIKNKMRYTFLWSDWTKAENELKKITNLQQKNDSDSENEIMCCAVNEMKKYLLGGSCQNSEELFQYLCQTIFDQIQDRITAENSIENDDMLD